MSIINTPILSKLTESAQDYKGNLSFGRIGGFICLISANIISIAGLFYSSNDKMLSYCSTIALQFLGGALALYGQSKATEVFSKKWAPDISETVVAESTVPAVPAVPAVPDQPQIPDPTGKATDD